MKWIRILAVVFASILASRAHADQVQLKQLGNYASPDAGAVGRPLASKLGDFISVADFMSPGQPDGTADNSAAWQYAADAACARASDGASIYVPSPSTGRNYVASDVWNSCPNTWRGGGRGGRGGTQTARGAEYSAANSGGLTTAHMGGTTVNYGGGANFFMRWSPNKNGTAAAPTWYASVSPQQLMMGGGIHDMNLYAGANDTKLFALQVYGTYNFSSSYLTIVAAYNGMEFYGDEMPSVDNVQMMHTQHWNYWLHGDLKGLTSSGAAAPAGSSDVSTRTDAFKGTNLQNIDNGGTNSAFLIQDMVDDTMLDHISSEGPAIGLNVGCSAYASVTPNFDPNGNNCPHFIFTYDFEAEFCVQTCVRATDFLDLRIHNGYFYNQNVSTAVNTLYFASENYTASALPIGRLTIDSGTLVFTAQADCIVLNGTMYDVDINHDEINGCNTANGGGYGINSESVLTHGKFNHNTIGNVDGYVGAHPPTAGIAIGSANAWIDAGDNIFDGVDTAYAPVRSFVTGAYAATIHVHDNLGPGAGPTMGACGASPPTPTGHDDDFVFTAGSGGPTSCSINFGTKRTTMPVCTVMPVDGSSANIASYTSNNSSVTFTAPSAITGSFTAICKDS